VAFEALDEGIGIHNGAGDLTQNVSVDLDLAIEVAGQVGQVVEERPRFSARR